jgi:hypothetical protein
MATTEHEDDFTFNVTYQANRPIKDLCQLSENSKIELFFYLLHN